MTLPPMIKLSITAARLRLHPRHTAVYEDTDRVYFKWAGLADNIKEQIERSFDLTTVLAGEDIEILPAFIPAGKME
jgi:hypothetical protein